MDWKLSHDSFSYLDRLKVSAFLLNKKNILTVGPKTAEFEYNMSVLAETQYAVGMSSGSTANHAIFELYKQELNYNIDNVVVLVPSTTWSSSITPAIMAGFKICFVDVNLNDFCFNYYSLEVECDKYTKMGKKIVIFPTSLIGFNPDFEQLNRIAKLYNAELWLDSCENTLGRLRDFSNVMGQCRFTTTSCYFSHQIVGLEFGFVFVKNTSDYEKLLMIKNHGLSRSLNKDSIERRIVEITNPNVDPQFLFACEGTNYRPTDIHAVFGLLDYKRRHKYYNHRREMYKLYFQLLNKDKYYLPFEGFNDPYQLNQENMVPFCIPIFFKVRNADYVKKTLNKNGIQTRPVIGGNLKRQPVFKNKPYILDDKPVESYSSSEFIHNRGCYVGLHAGVTEKHIRFLTNLLNSI